MLSSLAEAMVPSELAAALHSMPLHHHVLLGQHFPGVESRHDILRSVIRYHEDGHRQALHQLTHLYTIAVCPTKVAIDSPAAVHICNV